MDLSCYRDFGGTSGGAFGMRRLFRIQVNTEGVIRHGGRIKCTSAWMHAVRDPE